jgi:hypothetical protein
MCHRMYKLLRTRHPEKYEEIGKPSLIMNNTFSNNISFIRFLFGRQWKSMNDEGLATLGNVMLVFFTLYSLGLVLLVAVG